MSIESRIAPMMLEKLQGLANSFDDELVEKETSEKEARRILTSTKQELEATKVMSAEMALQKENPDTIAQSMENLAYMEKKVTGIIEQQQKLQLRVHAQHEEQKSNGHISSGEDDIGERVMLAKMLQEEENKRKNNVAKYSDALSKAGAGEKGDQYRKLLSLSLGAEVKHMDENIDTLLQQLAEDEDGQEGETVLPGVS